MRLGAKGVKVVCSGRLGGAEIARTEKYHAEFKDSNRYGKCTLYKDGKIWNQIFKNGSKKIEKHITGTPHLAFYIDGKPKKAT